jgi:hypothetical protein
VSAEALGWVFRHSPYRGDTFALHLAIADVANDTYQFRIWMKRAEMAQKARIGERTVTRALKKMVEDGLLELIKEAGGRGQVPEYRLLLKGDTMAPFAAERVTPETERVTNGAITPILNPRELKKDSAATPPTSDDPVKRTAHRLTVLAFEQPVKPELRDGGKGAFPAAMALIERVLRSRTPVADVERAITTGVEVWTLAGLQTAVARSKVRSRTRGGDHRSLGELLRDAAENERQEA